MRITKKALKISFLSALLATLTAHGGPAGMTVQSGTASFNHSGNQFNITTSQNTFLNWSSFNVNQNETVNFIQPSASSVAWNRVNSSNPSQILGSINANGVVVLMNSSGFYFGPNSYVKAAGFVASTAQGTPVDSDAGLFWQFNGAPPLAKIVNYGQINVAQGGSLFLIANHIENQGTLNAPAGTIGLAAGGEVLLSDRPDGRGLSAAVKLPSGSVDNNGQITADAGTIALHAQVVNQNGLVQANSVAERNGAIELVASDSVTLGENSTLSAQGDGSASSHGGQIRVDAGNNVTVGPVTSVAAADVAITARSGNIELLPGLNWILPDLSDSTAKLTLEAGRDILFDAEPGGDASRDARVTAGLGWSINMQAGRDFSAPNTVVPGTGNISLAGSASIETQNGNISLLAGDSITVNSGFIRTKAGGSINVEAVSGNVNAGTRPNGFQFYPNIGYLVDEDLGGISTANGGDVSLKAGRDVISYLPVTDGPLTDAGSGAFGADPGNVTVVAGHDVIGHYVLRNGVGTITAAHNAGANQEQLLALSLVTGGWTVSAGNSIYLQEVRNPNGIFNNAGSGSSTTKHYFDYSPDAYATLIAGDAIFLMGNSLPRAQFDGSITPIYPGTLTLSAGAGGISLGNDVTLFPSPTGNLKITTTDDGSLVNAKPGGDLASIIVSDSDKKQFRQAGDFGIADHGSGLLHLNDSEPVSLDISGDMTGILIGVPKRAEITVGGNMVNSRFDGQNLHPGDVTSITVTGDIINRNEFTTITVSQAPNFDLFNIAYPPLTGSATGLPGQFYYDPQTGKLTFQGRMDGAQLEALTQLSVRVYDANGQPVIDPKTGLPQTQVVQVLSPADAQALYSQSQDVPLNPDTGYRIGGGGTFNVSARNLDLGATAGIVSQGPRANAALATQFTRGADINVALRGDLNMFSTTISSLNGGNIFVTADGSATIGSKDFFGNNAVARGIFTTDPSDVTVIARGNININGSRIAAYDGGNIIVRSLQGNVDAGTGGLGSVAVEKIYVDPTTRKIRTYIPTIPGSGILATTFPPSQDSAFPRSINHVGNILVETPQGNIVASAGGVVQIPLNGVGDNSGTVTLNAGTADANGNVLYHGDIDASGSGVIGSTVILKATGNINGLIFARENINIDAKQSVNVTALAEGIVSVNSGGTISGTLIGVGGLTATGAAVDAALLSQNIAGGTTSSGQVGFSQGTVASSTSQSQQQQEPEKLSGRSKPNAEDEDLRKRSLAAAPRLTRTVGRVTLILPNN